MAQVTRLEDFNVRGTVSPRERYEQYVEDCKALPKAKQARFWLEILDRDRDVRRLLELSEKNRRRRY